MTILQGDCRDLLPTIGPSSVQTVVTSPPYWGLRDYGIAPSAWGGDPTCAHRWGPALIDRSRATPGTGGSGLTNGGQSQAKANRFEKRSAFCGRCGAWFGVLGLEPDPALYLEHLVGIFRLVREVMRPDGTLWLNMGDSYTDGGRGGDQGSTLGGTRRSQAESRKTAVRQLSAPFGLGRKQLLGMPWRLALALQADGWYLRRDIIWHKTNPMPESCTDRPTTAHEYLFLLSKRHRYHYDHVAVLEPVTGRAHRRSVGVGVGPIADARLPRGWDVGDGNHRGLAGNYTAARKARPQSRKRGHRELEQGKSNASADEAFTAIVEQRNRRSVWTIATSPFKGAHFATFPPGLVEPCVRAGTSPHVCSCGAPWRRITRKTTRFEGGSAVAGRTPEQINAGGKGDVRERKGGKNLRSGPVLVTETIGWASTCRHAAVPDAEGRSIVLDPFGGSFTTAMVADRLGCDVITMDANPEYVRDFSPRVARQLTIEDAGVGRA